VGIIDLIRTLAAEWVVYNILVNAISPTIVWKHFNEWLFEAEESRNSTELRYLGGVWLLDKT